MIALPTFRGVLGGFNPLRLTPALWLSDTGSNAAQWDDLSGNGRHATQAVGAAQPSIVTGAINGRQVRRFDGTDDAMSITTGMGMLRNVNGATCIAVYRWITNPTDPRVLISASTNSATSLRYAVGAGSVSRKLRVLGRRLDSDSLQILSGSTDNPTGYFVHASIADYANSDASIFLNGQQDGITTSFQTNGNTSDTDSASIMLATTASGVFSNIDIAEIIIFPTALSTADRQAVERYLSSKYAIALA
jgi:hypothetical protein